MRHLCNSHKQTTRLFLIATVSATTELGPSFPQRNRRPSWGVNTRHFQFFRGSELQLRHKRPKMQWASAPEENALHVAMRIRVLPAARLRPSFARTCVTFSLSNMTAIRIRSAAGAYDVHFSRGAIRRLPTLLARLGNSSGVYVLSSPRVWRHWGAHVTKSIRGWRGHHAILFDDAESAKRLATVEQTARKLIRAGADRDAI